MFPQNTASCIQHLYPDSKIDRDWMVKCENSVISIEYWNTDIGTEPTEDEIYRSNPQLNNLLCTRLTALTIGYSNNENFSHGLPPHPPRIHSFVYLSDNHYIEGLAKSFDFLHLLLSSGTNDEVVSACLRQISQKLPDGYPFLIESGQALATELIGQFPRLNAILRRLS